MAQDRALPPLTALQAFQAAGNAGSFVEAARRLSVTPSAISHQIRALEEWLGASLFERSARQVRLTREGRALLRSVDAAFVRIRTATEQLRERNGRVNRLRVSALPFFTSTWLIPRLTAFERAFPDIVLDIDTSNRVKDLAGEKIDVAIRNVRRAPTGLVAKKLLDIRMVPVCAPKLLDGPHALCRQRDLAHHTLIETSVRPDSWSRWLAAAGCRDLQPRRVVRFDTVPAGLEAAARGVGVALAMDPLFWDAPIAGALMVPFAPRVDGDASYYVVTRTGDSRRAAVRNFVDWLVKEMAEFRRAIASHAGRKQAFSGKKQSRT